MESIFKKYGVHPQVHGIHPPFHGIHLKNVWNPSPIPWREYGVHPPFHGFHMDYSGEGKVQQLMGRGLSQYFTVPHLFLQESRNLCCSKGGLCERKKVFCGRVTNSGWNGFKHGHQGVFDKGNVSGIFGASVCRSSSLDWKKDPNRTEPNRKRPDHRLRLHKF